MSKNNLWTIIILLVFGVGALYLWSGGKEKMVSPESSTTVNVTPESTTSPNGSPTPTVPPKSITLEQVGISGQSGTATFEPSGESTKVVISLLGTKSAVPQPAHIHLGKCPAPGDVKYPLNNVVGGKSESVIAVKIEDLFSTAMKPLAVNVHKSVEESSVYTACGDLK